MEEINPNKKYSIDFETLEKETEIEFFRASGPGGQYRDKRETAVRLRHIPSGIVIESQEERTQGNNRRLAFKRLQEKLIKLNKPKKKRIQTKVSRREKERRLSEKHRRGERKQLRKPPEIF